MPSDKLLRKIENGRQYRKFIETMAVREMAEGEENEEKIVEGHFTTFEQPYHLFNVENIEVWEQVSRDAFNETDMDDVIFQYDHEGRVFARTSNNTLTIEKDTNGMLCRADLGGTEIGRELYEEIKNGYTNKMSFGFRIDEESDKWELLEDGREKVTFTINKIGKLYDVSAVSLPANDGTDISARSAIDGVIEQHQAERLEAQKEAERLKKARARLNLEMEAW